MNNQTQSLSMHVDESLRKFRKAITLVSATIVSIVFSVVIIYSQKENDRLFLDAISQHVSNLIEMQERPELQRFLLSIKENKKNDFIVIQNDLVIGTTFGLDTLDKKVLHEPRRLSENIFRNKLVGKHNNSLQGEIVMISSMLPMVRLALLVSILVFTVGTLVGSRVSQNFLRAIDRSLSVVSDFTAAIRKLKTQDRTGLKKDTGVTELEEIKAAVLDAHDSLEEAKDRLASAKAKEMLAESYRRLIHDLSSPVQSLNSLLLMMKSGDQDTVKEGQALLPVIANRILNQIEAAKTNIDFETPRLNNADLRDCIASATKQAKTALNRKNINVEIRLPDKPVQFDFDDGLMLRAVDNIVRNAIEATKTKVIVELQKTRSEIRIKIDDDGCGLTLADVAEYLQGRKKSTKTDRKAIGLSGANHIVRTHGGRIIYNTSKLGGAGFEIRILT